MVTLRQNWTELSAHPELTRLIAAERSVGRDLISQGVLLRIWRLPGERANIGIWRAPNAAALDEQLDRLPLRRWLAAEILPLGVHELEKL